MKLKLITSFLAASLSLATTSVLADDGKTDLALKAPENTVNVGNQIGANQNPMNPSEVKLASPQYLVRNAKESPASLDPNTMGDSNSINIARPLFDTLIRQAPNGEYVGVAAESWSVSDDGLTWIFKLRPNALWSDGKPVKAADFVYSWQRLTTPKTGSPYADYLATAHVLNADKVVKGELDPSQLGVKATDDFTFVVTLEQPVPWFVQLVTLGVLAPVRQDVVEKYGDFWTSPKNIVTNGPYLLAENVINGHLLYKKFPEYWDAEHVTIETSRSIFINDINALYLKYLANEIMTADIPPPIYEKVLKERPNEVKSYLDPITYFIQVNVEKLPDPKVRRALKLLIDNRTLTDKVLRIGLATSVLTPYFLQDAQLATQAPYFNRSLEENSKEAVALLKAAGYSKENPLKLELTTSRDTQVTNAVVAIQSWFKNNSEELVDLTYTTQDSKTYASTVASKNYQLRYGYRRADYDQASSFYNTYLCTSSQNDSNWCNPNYDALVLQANKTLDPTKRAELYAQASLILQEENPVIPLFIKSARLLQSPALGGLSLKVKRRYLRDYFLIADEKVAPTAK